MNELPGLDLDYRGIDDLFKRTSVLQSWLYVEKTVAQAQAELGLIPMESAEVIGKNCLIEKLDQRRIEEGFLKTKHPLVPVINELARNCGEHGEYVHFGITTQNVIQTGLIVLLKRAHKAIEFSFDKLLYALGQLAMRHADTVMAGRTHSRHAVPITLGFKTAVWIEEFIMSMERLQEASQRTFSVMMGGAVGCHSALGVNGPAFQQRVAELLDINEMVIPSRAIRTHLCEYGNALVLMASVCHRIAEEIYQSSSEEFGELFECAPAGAVGSSTMPQKVNPMLCCQIIASSNRIYALAQSLVLMAYRPFESDASANTVFENTMGEIVELFAAILMPTEVLIRDLKVDTCKMQQNLKLSRGAIHAEFLMMELGHKHGKKTTHEMLHAIAGAARDGGKPFLSAITKIKGGAELKSQIEQRESDGKELGLCHEFATHMAEIALNISAVDLPNAAMRTLRLKSKAGR